MEMSPREENFSNRDRRCATRGPSVVFALGRGGIIIIIVIVVVVVAKGGEGRHSKPGLSEPPPGPSSPLAPR